MTSFYFTIVGTDDKPLYEIDFSVLNKTSNSSDVITRSKFSNEIKELLPFLANYSIDSIEEAQWTTNKFNLGKVDSFYNIKINAFITQSNIKFILCYEFDKLSTMHYKKNIENHIKLFFIEVNSLYVKCLLNPFYSLDDNITSHNFNYNIKLLIQKFL